MNVNRRFYCAVGLASGVFLLGGGVAQAGATALEAGHDMDPMAVRGLPTDLFTPTKGQYRLAVDHGQAEIRPDTESQATKNAGADRTEGLIPGLGGGNGGNGGNAILGLLGGIPGGSLLSSLAGGGGPLGALLGEGPLGTLLGGSKNTPANGGGPSAAATADWPRSQDQTGRGDDAATGWSQTGRGDDAATGWSQARPAATGTVGAGPASSGAAAGSSWQPSTLNQTATATYQVDGAAAMRGNSVQEESMPRADNGGKLLSGNMFGPNGPLGRMEILGGDTLAGLPLVGDLLGGGLSLDTLNNLPAVTNLVNRIGTEDVDKALPSLGNLPAVGKLSRTLLGAESASRPTEATRHRALAVHAVDKTKVTPQLLPLFGPDASGSQVLDGIIDQLPLAG